MKLRLLLGILLGAALLTGCGAPALGPSGSPTALVPAPAATAVPLPVHLLIPSIDASSTLRAVGMTAGAIDVPSDHEPMQAAWWDGSPRPGAVGPAVIVGHVDGQVGGKAGQPGIFSRLHLLGNGARIEVAQEGAGVVAFVVYRVQHLGKASFAEAAPEVLGNTKGPELRLITCGGKWDPVARSYEDNVVAYARIVTSP